MYGRWKREMGELFFGVNGLNIEFLETFLLFDLSKFKPPWPLCLPLLYV